MTERPKFSGVGQEMGMVSLAGWFHMDHPKVRWFHGNGYTVHVVVGTQERDFYDRNVSRAGKPAKPLLLECGRTIPVTASIGMAHDPPPTCRTCKAKYSAHLKSAGS